MNSSLKKDPTLKKNSFALLVDMSGISVSIAAFLISLFVTYDVVARTFFRLNNSWVTEVTIYLMGYITFIGAAYALKVGAHVSVDVLTQLLSTKASKRLFLTSDFIILIIVITLIFLSYQLVFDAWDSNEKSETLLSIRLWIPYLSFFIGMVLLLIATILQILSHLSESTNNHDKI